MNKSLFLIIILATSLVGIWFREGNIMGTAESGLPFYNFQLAFDANKSTWNKYALGFPTNISIASKPSYWLMAQLQNIGIPGFVLQASFFWIVLVVSGISIYLITVSLFPNLEKRFLILAVLFYWFNPFSMVNVWNRFLNNFFVFYMLLPVSFLFFLKGIQKKKYYYALLIGLIATVLSYALTSIAFNLLLWLVLFYAACFYIFISQKTIDRLFIVKFFLSSLFFWCLTNFWWISQAFNYVYSGSFSAVEQTSFSPWNNQQIFTQLSQRLGKLIYILRFQHASFFTDASSLKWVNFYISPLVSLFSFILPVIIFLPLAIVRKNRSVLFISGLVILGFFLSKGNNAPLGEILNPFFNKVGFLQTFRNAFEKFGFILPLAGAPLFAYGIYILTQKAQKWGKYVYILSVFLVVIMYGFPYWTSMVFTSGEPPANISKIGYQVKVPNYYKQASEWLISQRDNFRLLVLPLGGEGITYTWEKGYAGVELSNQILPITSISFQTNVPFYENISGDIEKIFTTEDDFTKVTDILNAKYIMLRNDIDWHQRRMRDPQSISDKLKEKNNFKLAAQFNEISFWENSNWVDKKIYSASRAISVSPQANISDAKWLSAGEVMLGSNTELRNISVNQYMLHPLVRFSLGMDSKQISRTGQEIFPHIRYLPDDKVYNLIFYKELFELNTASSVEGKINVGIKLLGKRLVEAKAASVLNNSKNMLISMKGYSNILNTLTPLFAEFPYLKLDFGKQLLKQEDFYDIFNEHKKILVDLASHFTNDKSVMEELQNAQKLLELTLIAAHIQPAFEFQDQENFPIKNRIVYKFNVKIPGEYEILWGNQSQNKYYEDSSKGETLIQVDDRVMLIKINYMDSGAKSFGRFYFNSGVHEVSMNSENGVNLINDPGEINLVVQHGITERTLYINNYDPFASYTVSLDYFIKMGSGMEVVIEANNAKLSFGKPDSDFYKLLGPDNYDFGEKHFKGMAKLSSGADGANLVLRVRPWNDCKSIFYRKNEARCKDESFRYPYDRTTEVSAKNISITRNLTDEPILVKVNQQSLDNPPNLQYEKIDDTKYLVRINDAKSPFILVLSELFDPGWKIFNESGNEISDKHFLVNAYANGWEIDQAGSYGLIVKFMPQDLLRPALYVSLFASALGVLFLIWRIRR